MSPRAPHDRPGLTLLIQLFGRDVLDRLERAGYGDEATIGSAGPERLASATGVSVALARRIVAVVEETRRVSSGAPVEAEPDRPETPREPRRRKPRPAREEAKSLEPRVEAVRAKMEADEADPFVDDVALVTWMGFTGKTPAGRLNFSVADRILDPVRPDGMAPEPPAPEPEPPAADSKAATPDPDRSPQRTLPGSFWSFGRPAAARGTPDEPVSRPPDTPDPRDVRAPRKVRDDH